MTSCSMEMTFLVRKMGTYPIESLNGWIAILILLFVGYSPCKDADGLPEVYR